MRLRLNLQTKWKNIDIENRKFPLFSNILFLKLWFRVNASKNAISSLNHFFELHSNEKIFLLDIDWLVKKVGLSLFKS
jgi:hypothetical protein